MATFDELVANTPVWLYATNRDIVDEMPQLIRMAEDQIFNLVDHDVFQSVITGMTLLDNQPDIDLTGLGILEVRAIRIAYRGDLSFTPLERRNLEALTMLYAQNRPARPRFYAEYGGQETLRVFPTPRGDFTFEITANVEPPRLSGAVQTNSLSLKFPRVYEKATLRQGALFMKNPADAATYEAEMMTALQEANLAIARRRRDETGTRPIETTNSAGM